MNFVTYSWVVVSDVVQNAVDSIRTEFYLSESNTELRGGTWSIVPPPWENGKYYWYKMITTFSDPEKEPVETKPVCISGIGSPGKGVVSITPEYAITKDKNTPPSSDSWKTQPDTWTYGTYLWTRFKVVYTDNTVEYTTPVCDTSWDSIGGIEIGGRNLLTNTSSIMGYEESKSNWTWESWGFIQTNTIDKATDSIHIVTTGNSYPTVEDLNHGVAFLPKGIPFIKGETYTFSIAIRGSHDLTNPFVAQIYYRNEYGENLYDTDSSVSWAIDEDKINNFRFKRKFITFSVPDDYDENVNSLWIVISCLEMDILLCRPQLERGNKPTDWKRAEEDVQSQISSVITNISGVSSVVDKIEGQITNKIWQTDMNEAINNYDGTKIESIRENITQQEQTLNGFKQDVKDLQTTVETKADGSTVEELSKKLSSAEQDLSGFKWTVENSYTTTEDLERNYATKSYAEQLADRIYWLVQDNSSSTSITLTPKAIEAVTNQYVIKSPNGKYVIIQNGYISADALRSNNYSAPTYYTDGYATEGTFYNLADGSITSKNFVLDSYGNVKLKGTVYATSGSFTGDIVANSLTLGSNVSIDGSKVTGIYYDNLYGKPDLTIYIKKDGTIGSTPSEGYTGFQVSSSGLLKASNAVIYGTIYASAGNIGGCTISNGLLSVPAARITGYLRADQIGAGTITVDKITSNNLQGLNGWINLNKGTFSYGSTYGNGISWDGYTLKVNGSGTFTGDIVANSLTLGYGVSIDGSKITGISYNNLTNKPNLDIYIQKDGTIGSTPSEGYTGFKVSSSGLLQASNAVIYGTVYASAGNIGGCNIQYGQLQVPAANITGTLSANQIVVGYDTLQSKLNSMANDILNAAKTATNYITMDYNGVMVSDTSKGSYGSNVLIASDGVNIRSGTTTVASFKANEIELGKGNKNSVIKLCDGFAEMSVVYEDYGGGSYSESFKIYSPTTEISGKDWLRLETGQGLSNTTFYNDEIVSTCYGTNNESIFSIYAGQSDAYINLHIFNQNEVNDFEITSRNTTTNHTIISEQYMQATKGFTCGSATDNFQNSVLWSGSALWPSDSHTCNFSKPVSQQPHGILLVFRGYDGSALNADWHTFFVSKKEISSHQGQGHSFFLSHTPGTNFSTKYIYIYDSYLKGHANNNQSGTGSDGVKYTNNKYVLQYVVGV